ncbi:hypothetical protein C8034_v005263 [Colletotrichum sidae]|uniref:Uncharacterized protein n=1 Tax=Colletotrichum sidae TaxID=1347389 RepID=A0A4R8T6Z9_9PEZI|nr:hypothetical protein C8034_v005263 [Colletotrichum sidae]
MNDTALLNELTFAPGSSSTASSADYVLKGNRGGTSDCSSHIFTGADGHPVRCSVKTKCTVVSGPLISPEIRITHVYETIEHLDLRKEQTAMHMFIPINAVAAQPVVDKSVDLDKVEVAISVDAARITIVKRDVPQQTQLLQGLESWLTLIPRKGDATVVLPFTYYGYVSIYFEQRYVDVLKGEYFRPKDRIVDGELVRMRKNAGSQILPIDGDDILKDCTRRRARVPAAFVFHENDSRMVRLQASAREDYLSELSKVAPLAASSHSCAILPDLSFS